MKKAIFIICFHILLCSLSLSQSFTESNLPIMIINTDQGVEITDSPRVRAAMKIINRGNGERNYLSDQDNSAYLNYNGRIDIEVRGSSSQFTAKKQYGFTTRKDDNVTNNNVSLLDMPKENDWIINSMTFDPALIRDYLTYNLSRQIGEYASRTAYCEVIVNGMYEGLYLLQEKIKADNKRVDVIKIGLSDNSIPDLTGGYITKADKTTGGDSIAWSMQSFLNTPVDYIHQLPKPENVTSQQNDYIRNQFMLLQTTAFTNNISPITGFPSVIDVTSFIDYMIISEMASNADSYMYSTYFHKDRNGKLRAGPVWDNDLTFGNDLFFWGYDRSKTDIWQFSNGDNEGSRFWRDLFNNLTYKCYLSKRWNELIQPEQPLNLSVLDTFIDQTVSVISEAAIRNNGQWGIAGNPADRISSIKHFLELRINWITENIGSFSECANTPVPQLVITKIMYHPETTAGFPLSDDQEFIEITNNGDQIVDLTGIYFGGTGLVYQFPGNTTIDPRSSIILASNSPIFRAKYGVSPFGQFTRNLSNKDGNILLADAFGNVIDHVSYTDTIPWPEADGNGSYLKLISPDLDNNVAANWIASNDIILSDQNIPSDIGLLLFPNPVTDILRIQGGTDIVSLRLFDISGRLLLTVKVSNKSFELDMKRFARGIYIVRVQTLNNTYSRKIVKE